MKASRIDDTLAAIRTEADASFAKYGDYASTHEALGVLEEERDELLAAIHSNSLASVYIEAKQVAAVALRLAELCDRALRGEADAFKTRSGA